MRTATYDGRHDQLELASGRILPRGVPTEVSEEEARYLAAEARAYLQVTISDAPDSGAEEED
jgi:hypothetical protein